MRYGFLGDVLQTTPVLKALREVYPKARIDYWVSDVAAPALANNPHISSIVSADRHGKLNPRRPFGVFRHTLKLRQAHYDLAICLGSDPFYGFLAWLAGIKYRAGLIVNKKKTAFLHVWIETPLSDRASRQKRYLELLHQLHIEIAAGAEKIQLFWTTEDERKTDALLGHDHGKLLALFCGTGPERFRPWAKRRWNVDSWMSLAERIIRSYPDMKILLIGTDREAETNKRIASVLPEDRVLDISGKTGFSQLGAVLKRCMLLVSNDSAPTFVAAAVDCPSVVIYGPEWPERSRPMGTHKWYSISVDIECRDRCASFPDKALVCKNECMNGITVEMVLNKVESAMKNERASFEV